MTIFCATCNMDITYDEEIALEKGEYADSNNYDEINNNWYCECCYEILLNEREFV